MSTIEIIRGNKVLASVSGEKEAQLLYKGTYQQEDIIHFVTDYEYAVVQVDQQVKPARVCPPTKEFTFRLPLMGIDPAVYAPGTFMGDKHV